MLSATENNTVTAPEMADAQSLCNDLRSLLVRSEKALSEGDVQDNVMQLERWVESYRRGLSAAEKISNNGLDMLHQARDQLKLALDERIRLEGEGGNAADVDQAKRVEELNSALRRLERLIPVISASFQCFSKSEEVAGNVH